MESSTSRGDSQIPDDVESMDCNDDGQAPIIQGQAGEQKSDGQAGGKKSDDQAGGQRPDAALLESIPDVTEQPGTGRLAVSNSTLNTMLSNPRNVEVERQRANVRQRVTQEVPKLPRESWVKIVPRQP